MSEQRGMAIVDEYLRTRESCDQLPRTAFSLSDVTFLTGATRSQLFPDLPTVAEAGLPGYEAVLHYGIVAPAGTPQPVVEKLNAALNAALANDEVKRRLAVEGAEALPLGPEAYAADIANEESKWSEIIRKSGMKGE